MKEFGKGEDAGDSDESTLYEYEKGGHMRIRTAPEGGAIVYEEGLRENLYDSPVRAYINTSVQEREILEKAKKSSWEGSETAPFLTQGAYGSHSFISVKGKDKNGLRERG